MSSFGFWLAWLLAFGDPESLSNPPLYEGLPTRLESQFLERSAFVEFEGDSKFIAPVAAEVRINGELIPVNDSEGILRYFKHWNGARLARGTRIESEKDSQGRERWTYPIGTQLVDLVELRSDIRKFYELRLSTRLPGGRWAFGNYIQGASGEWELATYSGVEAGEIRFVKDGAPIRFEFKRVNLGSCQACHFATSMSRYQYRNVGEVGPCGLVPSNSTLRTDWATRYFQMHGESPF